ncbi:MAG: DUF861 domain-containing protein [Moraxellaceae bacterium]|nr:DUF861 domain-containing protein [Moraxellaceae bacterium]
MAALFVAGQGQQQSQASIDYPKTERLLKGSPQRLTYSLYEHPHMSCGIWACEVGAWRIEFAANKQEFFTVIAGKVRLHDSQGDFIDIGAGDAAVIPPNFCGIFEVLEKIGTYALRCN